MAAYRSRRSGLTGEFPCWNSKTKIIFRWRSTENGGKEIHRRWKTLISGTEIPISIINERNYIISIFLHSPAPSVVGKPLKFVPHRI